MGTRSWNQNYTNKYINGESIYVKASYFDSDHQASLRVKFKIDGTVSSVKYMVKSLKYRMKTDI